MDDDAESTQELDEAYDDGDEPVGRPSAEPDVFLDVPQLTVDEITLDVEDLQAQVSLRANVLDLLNLSVGADVSLGGVHLDIKGVEAQALLKVRLDNVAEIIGRVLTTIDRNPQVLTQVTSGLGAAAEELASGAGGAVGELGRGTGAAVGDVGVSAGQAVEDAGRAVEKGAGRAVESVGDTVGGAVGDTGRDTAERGRETGETSARAVKKTAGGTGAAKRARERREKAGRAGGGATPRRPLRRREGEGRSEGRPP